MLRPNEQPSTNVERAQNILQTHNTFDLNTFGSTQVTLAKMQKSLYEAIYNRSVKTVKKILTYHQNITNCQDQAGRSPIHYALFCYELFYEKNLGKDSQKFIEILRLLLKAGEPASTHLLLWACQKGYAEFVKYYLQKSSLSNIHNYQQETALCLAIEAGSFEVIKCLTASSAGITRLVKNDFSVFSYLLAQSPDWLSLQELKKIIHLFLNADFRADEALLLWACREGCEEFVQACLRQGLPANARNCKQDTSLCLAVQSGSFEVIKCLIKNGADMIISKATNNSFLDYLIRQWSHLFTLEEITKLNALFKKKHGNRFSDIIGTYKLALVYYHSPDQNNIFLNHQHEWPTNIVPLADNPLFFLDLISKTKVSYIKTASTRRKILNNMLMKSAWLANFKDYAGRTALCLAVEQSDYQVVQILLQYGADIHYRDHKNRTLLTRFMHKVWFLENGCERSASKTVDILLQAKVKPIPELLLWSCVQGYADLVKYCLEQGIAPDDRKNFHKDLILEKNYKQVSTKTIDNNIYFDKKTPLFFAVMHGHVEIVDILLKYKADIHCETYTGKSLLSYWLQDVSLYFSKTIQQAVVDLLLKAGALITPELLLWAAKIGNEKIVKYCLTKNISVDIQDRFKATPLCLATLQLYTRGKGLRYRQGSTYCLDSMYRQYINIVRLLLIHGACVNHRNASGKTALMQASEQEHSFDTMPITQLLLQWGADTRHILNPTIKHKVAPYFQVTYEIVREQLQLQGNAQWTSFDIQQHLCLRSQLIKYQKEKDLLEYCTPKKKQWLRKQYSSFSIALIENSYTRLPSEICDLVFFYYWLQDLSALKNNIEGENLSRIVTSFIKFHGVITWENFFDSRAYDLRYKNAASYNRPS